MVQPVICANCNQDRGFREAATEALACPRCGAFELLDQIAFDWRQTCWNRIKTIPPRCLMSFHSQFEERPANNRPECSVWRISCACGCGAGQVLGYQVPNSRYLLGPLSFQCGRCGRQTEMLNTEKHGEAGELHPQFAIPSRTGSPVPYACPKCLGHDFNVACVFVVPDAAFDLVEDDLLEQSGFGYLDNIENLFDLFSADCICVACKTMSCAANFELK